MVGYFKMAQLIAHVCLRCIMCAIWSFNPPYSTELLT